MINKLVSAISTAIYNAFGEDYEIYKESIEQGLNEPCFFIQSVAPSSSKEIKNRKRKSYLFLIQYFPKDAEAYAEINNVIDSLDDVLDEITADGEIYRCSESSAETVDKVLNYQITYDFFMLNEETAELMDDFEYENAVKE